MGIVFSEVTACQTAQNLNISLSFGILFRLLCFKLYSNISVINIKYNKFIAMHLFFSVSGKSIVLFKLYDRWRKEAKQIKGPHHYQGQASSTRKNLYHICHHKQSPTMGFPPSSLKHHPEANSRHQTLQNISPNPYNAAANKRTVIFLRVAT